jgi:hypothetical protein
LVEVEGLLTRGSFIRRHYAAFLATTLPSTKTRHLFMPPKVELLANTRESKNRVKYARGGNQHLRACTDGARAAADAPLELCSWNSSSVVTALEEMMSSPLLVVVVRTARESSFRQGTKEIYFM